MPGANLLCAVLGALLLHSGAFAAQSAPHVALLTTMGSFVVRLDPEHAPVSAANFLRYVNEKHFDDTLFYRVVPGFVIQAGSFGADGKERPTHEPIALEANNGLKNVRGAISMARNDSPNSADAEFFIVLADTPPMLTMRNCAFERGLAACIARTSISLPVPLSPSISTGV